MSKVKTGITLFSLGTPYLKGELDLEGENSKCRPFFLHRHTEPLLPESVWDLSQSALVSDKSDAPGHTSTVPCP